MNVLKKVVKKVENSKIVKNPKFLVIGLIIIVAIIALIYFIFLKYSPIMNFKYEGYAISGKEITENLLVLGEADNTNTNKNIELAKIEEQGTIFKKLNDYFVGNKEKTEINLNYPIYINGNSSLYNLSEASTLISKDFEEITGYPNLSISEGKIYDGNNLERADGKEYIFVKTNEGIYINVVEIKITTTANEYTIPVNSIIAFTENKVRYYSINNNILVFNEINDIDNNSNVEIVENRYTYEELLTRLGIIKDEINNNQNEENTQNNIIQENTSNTENNETEDNNKENTEQEPTEETNQGEQVYIKPEVSSTDFTAEVYTAQSLLSIKDPAGRIIEAPTFEVYAEGKLYLRRVYTNSGTIVINGLKPNTEYTVVGKYVYLNENEQKIENTFYEGSFKTKGYEALGAITISKENGEIYNNKIQLSKVKITSDLNAEEIKGINKIEIVADGIKTTVKNEQANMLLQGKEVTLETSEGLKSNKKIEYEIKIYDLLGEELKVENNKGETRTSKQEPIARVTVKEQDIVSVTLDLKLTNKDNAEMENYKYIITRANGETIKEEKLAENETEIKIDDLDSNQYYEIKIYADYDIEDGKGMQREQEIGKLVFATQPLSTLGSIEMQVEGKDISTTKATIGYKIDEERTDKRLIQILEEIKIEIVEKETQEVAKEKEIRGEELEGLKLGGKKEEIYEGLKSNTTYEIRITSKVKQGIKEEDIQVTYNYKEFTTLRSTAKVEIQNQFVTGEMIDFDVRIEDRDKAVLNNKVRMELRDEDGNLVDLTEVETNKEYIRKTYDRLEEKKKYKLSFYADQYNEGNTDETYKINYLIKEIEIITEPGISGSIGILELYKEAAGKNLIDASSKNNWQGNYVGYGNNSYGKEYDSENDILTITTTSISNTKQVYKYDLSKYANQQVTISFEGKMTENSTASIVVGASVKENMDELYSNDWVKYEYTAYLDSTGLLGFYVGTKDSEEGYLYLKNLQVELGEKKTIYEKFTYNLKLNANIKLEDKRNEIVDGKYYVKIYKDNQLEQKIEYAELIEELNSIDVNKEYILESEKNYKLELAIEIRGREYILDSIEFDTKDGKEIKGITSIDDWFKINPEGTYIVLTDLDFTTTTKNYSVCAGSNYGFSGTIDFNGYSVNVDTHSTFNLISYISTNGVLKNIVFNVDLSSDVEIANRYFLFIANYGTIDNLYVRIIKTSQKENRNIAIIGQTNYGAISNFVIDSQVELYGNQAFTYGIWTNSGIIKNGYIKGKDIQVLGEILSGSRDVGGLVKSNSVNGTISNIYSLINVSVEKYKNDSSESVGTIIGLNSGEAYNLYAVGDSANKQYGPIMGASSITNLTNNYYISDDIYNNTFNQKVSKLVLWDKNFQNNTLNSDNAFDVDTMVEQGYYPQVKLNDCMPKQEYIALPEVKDEDLPDILSSEVIEKNNSSAKVKLYVHNPSAETITNIQIKNVGTRILSQTYQDKKSEVILELYNPIMYVSSYDVLSLETKGSYSLPYKREYEENEKIIAVDFYKEIRTIDDWKNIGKSANENYVLMEDLDFANQGNSIVINNTISGIINGNNHSIKNIFLDRAGWGLINTLSGKIENLYIQNFRNLNDAGAYVSLIDYIYNGAEINNVHVKDVQMTLAGDSTASNIMIGSLVGYVNRGNIINSSVTNIDVKISNNTNTLYVGGLVGRGLYLNIDNSFVQNVTIHSKKAYGDSAIGGIIGTANISNINNSYVTGEIEEENNYVGGIVGQMISGSAKNCFSMVDVETSGSYMGGGYGLLTSSIIENNLILGNIYSTQENNIGRIYGINTNMTVFNYNNNYVYYGQLVNGYEEDISENTLTEEQLCENQTYINKLKWSEEFCYTEVAQGILPKLYYKGTTNLLPNQEDLPIKNNNEQLEVQDVEISKQIDNADIRLEIENRNNLQITDIKIEDMTVVIKNNVSREGITYIELNAVPSRYYDSYKLSEINYIDKDINKKQKFSVKIDAQFFKELYSFDDWQTIEDGTTQNYKIMNDIDFNNRTDVKTDVTIGRLETNGENYSLKNIAIANADANITGLIKNITISLENVTFDNINISSSVAGNLNTGIGVIYSQEGDMEDVTFKNIVINAPKRSYVGAIGRNNANTYNVTINNVNITACNYVGAFYGYSNKTKAEGTRTIVASDIVVEGKTETGGLIGNSNDYINSIIVNNVEVIGTDNVGGVAGRAYDLLEVEADNMNVTGENSVGGVFGISGYSTTNKIYNKITNSIVKGSIARIGGLTGNSVDYGIGLRIIDNCEVYGVGVNTTKVGGAIGESGTNMRDTFVTNTIVKSTGDEVGGIAGSSTTGTNDYFVSQNNTVEGNSSVGGVVGRASGGKYSYGYVANTTVKGYRQNVSGMIGYLNNENSTAVQQVNALYNVYSAKTNITGKENVGGIIGKLDKDLFVPETNYYNIFVEAYIDAKNARNKSILIGSNPEKNKQFNNLYVYKYNTINNEYINLDENFLLESQILEREVLEKIETWKQIIKLNSGSFQFNDVEEGKYPRSAYTYNGIKPELEEVDLPQDPIEEEDNLEIDEVEENTFTYENKKIQTYSTYSVITSTDGSKATRSAKLYVKDNTLYALPTVLAVDEKGNEIIPVANNLILDSYNGKEYETVLGSDGRVYDLKEPITYPENFVNSDIESIGNNLNSDVKEVEVVYKNGDKIKFNYQTGEVISSSEAKDVEKTGLFDYLKEKISEIGNSNSEVSQEIRTKYEESKKLQTKLEETAVEEAIEKQKIANAEQETEGVTTTENNATNNSLTENKYINVYDKEIDGYLIYNEEELLDTTKEEVVSENEKIEANNLNEYYASGVETKNTKMGIVWIVVSIIGVGIILFVLKKNLKKKA